VFFLIDRRLGTLYISLYNSTFILLGSLPATEEDSEVKNAFFLILWDCNSNWCVCVCVCVVCPMEKVMYDKMTRLSWKEERWFKLPSVRPVFHPFYRPYNTDLYFRSMPFNRRNIYMIIAARCVRKVSRRRTFLDYVSCSLVSFIANKRTRQESSSGLK